MFKEHNLFMISCFSQKTWRNKINVIFRKGINCFISVKATEPLQTLTNFCNYLQVIKLSFNMRTCARQKNRMSNHTIPRIELLLKCLACKPRQLKGEIFVARHLIWYDISHDQCLKIIIDDFKVDLRKIIFIYHIWE